MTTQTEPSARHLLPRFAQQFTHPAFGKPLCRQSMVVLHPDLLGEDKQYWVLDGSVEVLPKAEDLHLFLVIIDDSVFERFTNILKTQPTYVVEDVADVPGDSESGFVGVPIEESIAMHSSYAARMAINLEPYWLHEEPRLFEMVEAEELTGGRFPVFILPEDWAERRDELTAMVNIHGDPVYPQQIWDPEGHGYISRTYDSRGDYAIQPFE